MSNIFKKTIEQIKYKKNRLENGKLNTIPYPYPSLNRYFPGLLPESQQVLTTGSGVGKTWLALDMYTVQAYEFYKANRGKIDIKVFHFCLEDSVTLVQKKLISKRFFDEKGVRISTFKLDSYFEDDKISDNLLKDIESLGPHFDEFYKKVELIDNVSNPTGIYKHVKKWLDENGKHKDENNIEIKADKLNQYWKDNPGKQTFYTPDNPDRIVLVVIDNMQNITSESGLSKWQTLDRFCRTYMRNSLCNYYKTCNLIIAQQTADKERAQYTAAGTTVEDKFMPSLDGISEYKNITHTAHIVYGLFSPYRYKAEDFDDGSCEYDINYLQDHYRCLQVLKSNYVEANLIQSLFFDGSIGLFAEMPKTDDFQGMNKIQHHIETKRKFDKGIKPINIQNTKENIE
jgi:hypothetical protein